MTLPAAAGASPADEPFAPASALQGDGIRLDVLRAGRAGVEPLFMVVGPDRDPWELTSLASALTGPHGLYVLSQSLREVDEERQTIGAHAARMASAILRLQQAGPYRLGGHASGGAIALEVARHLRAAGAAVDALFLIDAVDERGRFRPRPYDGPITLIVPTVGRNGAFDAVRLWQGSAAPPHVQRIEAHPSTILREPASETIANVIDRRLSVAEGASTGLRPMPGFERLLLLTTVRWFSDARLAHSLVEAGFSVSACRPRGHALGLVDGLSVDRRLSRLFPERSLVRAIEETSPDVVVPGDEGALALLRRARRGARSAGPELAAVLERSLGDGCEREATSSRAALVDAAVRAGVPAPETRVIADEGALGAWVDGRPMPIVLKTDGSFGGRGVAIVRDPEGLARAWRAISGPPGLTRALKRAVVDSDGSSLSMWARRARPVVNAQEFVEGREAIATVACADGDVLAIACLEVVRTTEPKGPAAVVRVIDHAGMTEAVHRLVRRLGLSGFCGFDFMLTEDGKAQVLELNPRGTPTAYLLVEGERPRGDVLTLFPADPAEDDGERAGCPVDVPRRAPLLIGAGETMIARKGRPVPRLVTWVTKRFSPLP